MAVLISSANGLLACGSPPTEAEVVAEMKRFDADGDGAWSRAEYMQWAMQYVDRERMGEKYYQEQQALSEENFDKFYDKNRNGMLAVDELTFIAQKLC